MEIVHRDCNINLKLNRKIPIAFLNLKNYDSHLIMQELGKLNLKVSVISNVLEKYMSFTINNKISVIDSFQFLSSSLDSLVKNLSKDDFKYLGQIFDKNKLDLVKEKGFCLYKYMTDFEMFKEKLQTKFYNSLAGKKNSDKEYGHALNVRNKFDMKTIKNYDDLHLKCDVLLLADVFEKFRNNHLKNYGLFPRYYFSAPGLGWDAMLKTTKIRLELITDPDMHVFFEKCTKV